MRAFGTALVLLAAASSARADWKTLDGQSAPNFKVDKWINAPEGGDIDDLRGKVILLEFWATW